MSLDSNYCIHGNNVEHTDCLFCYVESQKLLRARPLAGPTHVPTHLIPPHPTHPKAELGKQKAQLQLIPPEFLLHTARALKEGADRYGPYNWRETGVDNMSYIGAMMRHLAAYMAGEDVDPDSPTGKHHLAGVAASVAIVLDCASVGMLRDTRPHTKLAKKKDDK